MKTWIWILIIVAFAASAFFIGKVIGKNSKKDNKPSTNQKLSDEPLTVEQKEKIKKFKKELDILDRDISEASIAGRGSSTLRDGFLLKRKKLISLANKEVCGEGYQMSEVCMKCVKIGSVNCPPTWTQGS